MQRTDEAGSRAAVDEERRRRVARLRAVHDARGLAGLVAYCEWVLTGESSENPLRSRVPRAEGIFRAERIGHRSGGEPAPLGSAPAG
jgi:hypothetical protein